MAPGGHRSHDGQVGRAVSTRPARCGRSRVESHIRPSGEHLDCWLVGARRACSISGGRGRHRPGRLTRAEGELGDHQGLALHWQQQSRQRTSTRGARSGIGAPTRADGVPKRCRVEVRAQVADLAERDQTVGLAPVAYQVANGSRSETKRWGGQDAGPPCALAGHHGQRQTAAALGGRRTVGPPEHLAPMEARRVGADRAVQQDLHARTGRLATELVGEPGGGRRRPREQDGTAAQVRCHVVARAPRQAEVAAAARRECSLVRGGHRLHGRLPLDQHLRGVLHRLSLPVQRRRMAPKRYGKDDDHKEDDAHQRRPAPGEDGGLRSICSRPAPASR